MIKLTKINGAECFLNHTLFEIIEESPDTCIMMNNGNRYLVKESGEQIREMVISFNIEVMRRAGVGQLLLKESEKSNYREDPENSN